MLLVFVITALLMATLVGLAATRSNHLRVERRESIVGPSATIFAQSDDFHRRST